MTDEKICGEVWSVWGKKSRGLPVLHMLGDGLLSERCNKGLHNTDTLAKATM